MAVPSPAAVPNTTWAPQPRRRRPARHLRRAFGTSIVLVWPALFLMPGAALLLSWWLGVL